MGRVQSLGARPVAVGPDDAAPHTREVASALQARGRQLGRRMVQLGTAHGARRRFRQGALWRCVLGCCLWWRCAAWRPPMREGAWWREAMRGLLATCVRPSAQTSGPRHARHGRRWDESTAAGLPAQKGGHSLITRSHTHTHPRMAPPPPEGRGLHPGEASLKGGHSGSSARRNYRTFSGKRIYGRRQNSIASEMRSLSVFRCQSHPRQ